MEFVQHFSSKYFLKIPFVREILPKIGCLSMNGLKDALNVASAVCLFCCLQTDYITLEEIEVDIDPVEVAYGVNL